jgi:hypothetical protein
MPEGNEVQTTPTAEGAKPDEQLGEGGKRALDAERTARKAAEDSARQLQAQLDQFKQAQMSDLERAQTAAQQAQQAAAQAQAEALRWRIAAKHGISDEDAETFLTGADEASLTRQAARLAALNPSTPGTPRPDLSQGGTGAALPLNSDGLEQALKGVLGII